MNNNSFLKTLLIKNKTAPVTRCLRIGQFPLLVIFFVLILLLPHVSFSQDISGVWVGNMYNDTTRENIHYELAINEFNGKAGGYSHTTFVINGKNNIGVKSVKIKMKDDKVSVVDEKFVYNNYEEPPAKGVRMFSDLVLSENDSAEVLRGTWRTNVTKIYRPLTGTIFLEKKKKIKPEETIIVAKLVELGLSDKLSFLSPRAVSKHIVAVNDEAAAPGKNIAPVSPSKDNEVIDERKVQEDLAKAEQLKAQKTKEDPLLAKQLKIQQAKDELAKAEQLKVQKAKEDSLIAAQIKAQQAKDELAKAEQQKVQKAKDDSLIAEQLKIQKAKDELAKAEQLKAQEDSLIAEQIKIQKAKDELAKAEQLKAQEDSLIAEQIKAQQAKDELAKAEQQKVQKAKEDSLIAAQIKAQQAKDELAKAEQQKVQKAKDDSLIAAQIKAQQAKDELAKAEQQKVQKAKDDSLIAAQIKIQKAKDELAKAEQIKVQKAKEDALKEEQIKAQQVQEELGKAAEIKAQSLVPKAAADIEKRKIETIRTVEISQDSLVLSLYDNGTVDGDTVSVLLNGKVIWPRVGLLERAINKTIYLTPEMGDSISIILYAENLGSIPPNTGLLVIREAKRIYEIRFSGDLNKNSGIILLRKKKE